MSSDVNPESHHSTPDSPWESPGKISFAHPSDLTRPQKTNPTEADASIRHQASAPSDTDTDGAMTGGASGTVPGPPSPIPTLTTAPAPPSPTPAEQPHSNLHNNYQAGVPNVPTPPTDPMVQMLLQQMHAQQPLVQLMLSTQAKINTTPQTEIP